jgi:hypothetical protein
LLAVAIRFAFILFSASESIDRHFPDGASWYFRAVLVIRQFQFQLFDNKYNRRIQKIEYAKSSVGSARIVIIDDRKKTTIILQGLNCAQRAEKYGRSR